jgi:beta-mannosidase
MRKILIVLILLQGYFLNAQNLKSVSLNGSWSLYYSVQNKNTPATPDELKTNSWTKIPAIVPGNVELDLLAAGAIKNPEIGNNIYDLRKYEGYQWCYLKNHYSI